MNIIRNKRCVIKVIMIKELGMMDVKIKIEVIDKKGRKEKKTGEVYNI